jgi:antitoxin component YwqK of YwqJK toxin-antitoxin module
VNGRLEGEMIYFDEKGKMLKSSLWVNEKETNVIECKDEIVEKKLPPSKTPAKKKSPAKKPTAKPPVKK